MVYSGVKATKVYTCHHPYWVMSPRKLDLIHHLILLLDTFVIRRADVVVALNPKCQQRFIETCRVNKERVPVIATGVATDIIA